MQFMEADRTVCDKLLPGLRQQLAELPLPSWSPTNSPAIEIFRAHGGTNLTVPESYGGLDASPLDTARVVRALAAQAPSMAVATMMHHFSLGTLFAVAELVGGDSDLEELLLQAGRRRAAAGGVRVRGRPYRARDPVADDAAGGGAGRVSGQRLEEAVQPVAVDGPADRERRHRAAGRHAPRMGLLMLPADTPGVSVHPFWSTFALAGAESNEVRLTDVLVTPEQIIAPDPALAGAMDRLTTVGLIWFQMTVCAAYTGIASALVERVLPAARGSVSDRAALAVRIESAAALTEGLARRIMAGETDNDALAAALVTRFAVQDAIAATVNQAVELLGGMAYIGSSDVAYLVAASHAHRVPPAVAVQHAPAGCSTTTRATRWWSRDGPSTLDSYRRHLSSAGRPSARCSAGTSRCTPPAPGCARRVGPGAAELRRLRGLPHRRPASQGGGGGSRAARPQPRGHPAVAGTAGRAGRRGARVGHAARAGPRALRLQWHGSRRGGAEAGAGQREAARGRDGRRIPRQDARRAVGDRETVVPEAVPAAAAGVSHVPFGSTWPRSPKSWPGTTTAPCA